MKFLKHFNESLFDKISREDAYKKFPPVDFSYRDISEISDFLNENYPDIDYSIGKSLLNQNSRPFTVEFLRFLRNPDPQGQDETSKSWFNKKEDESLSIFRSLNDDNVFVFSYSKQPAFYAEKHIFAIIKTKDDYFIVFKMNRTLRSHAYDFITHSFLCDDIDGLLEFLETHLNSNLSNLEFSDRHKMYLP